MQKTLSIIQLISKIARILSIIAAVCCIIGVVSCAVAMITLSLGIIGSVEIGELTVKGFLIDTTGLSIEQIQIAIATTIVMLAGQAAISFIASRYFKRELDDGTPFTLSGAKAMLNFGILTVAINLGTRIIASIVGSVMCGLMEEIYTLSNDFDSTFLIGIIIIIISVVLKYGAEREETRIEK